MRLRVIQAENTQNCVPNEKCLFPELGPGVSQSIRKVSLFFYVPRILLIIVIRVRALCSFGGDSEHVRIRQNVNVNKPALLLDLLLFKQARLISESVLREI